MGPLTDEEADFFEKIMSVFDQLGGLSAQLLSDGVHDSGRLRCFYKQDDRDISFYLECNGQELRLGGYFGDDIVPHEIIEYVNKKFPSAKYACVGNNMHLWRGIKI